jgi:hypothetical protein
LPARRAANHQELLALMSAASLQPRFSIEQSVAAVEAIGGLKAGHFLAHQRAWSILVQRLRPAVQDSPAVRECYEVLRPEAERRRGMHAALPDNLRRLESLATKCGIEVFAFKGLGSRTMYCDPTVRDFSDLDIFVRDRADAARLSRCIREEFGYSHNDQELPWFKYDASTGLLYGQINLVAPADGSGIGVDLHFGDYSVRHCGRLELIGSLPLLRGGMHTMPLEENLACMVNNAAGDYFVTAKDINDLLMAFALPSFDVTRFVAPLRRANLMGFFKFMAARLRSVAVLTAEQEARLNSIQLTRTFEPAPTVNAPNWRRRCLGTTVHAYGISRPRGLLPAAKIAISGYRYYRKPLKLTVIAKVPRGGPEPLGLNQWTCVRLVPLDLALRLAAAHPAQPPAPAGPERLGTARTSAFPGDPGIERITTPAGTLMRVDGETFVGTVFYRIPVGLIEQARLANRREPGC